MRLFRWLLIIVLVGIIALTGHAQPPVPVVAFHSMGDLPGGPTYSVVRDATRVGTTIYAVGGSAQVNQVLCSSPGVPAGCVGAIGPDTPVLWTYETSTSSSTLTALPNIVVNTTANNPMQAQAITRDAAYIAGQAHNAASGGVRVAVRDERALVPSATAIFNLSVSPYSVGYTQPTLAVSISDDGSVMGGNVNAGGVARAARFDTVNSAGNALVPILGGFTGNNLTTRAISADGKVMAGTALPASGSNTQAYRYFFNTTTNTGFVFGVPFSPDGGTRNRALALAPNGRYMLVSGNSTHYPNGEVMLYDNGTGPGTATLTELGSPNTAWAPAGIAGMTADASVAILHFASPSGSQSALPYFHNPQGWFTLTSVLRRNGIDLRSQGWDMTSLNITGMSPDGTLVYGAAQHNGNWEGFVIDLPADYLKNFDAPATPVSNTSIVGAWMKSGYTPGSANGSVVVLLPNGTYYILASDVPAGDSAANGFERGTFSWDSDTGIVVFDTRVDTNGDAGADNDRSDITAAVVGDVLTVTIPNDETLTLYRVPTDVTNVMGAWVSGDSTADDSSSVLVVLADGTYFIAQDGPNNDPTGHDGIERGTIGWNPITHVITATTLLDTNGQWGLSNPKGVQTAVLSSDGLVATGSDDSPDGSFTITRLVDPNAVQPQILSALSATATTSAPFSYTITATHAPSSFSAGGLPPGLSVDTSTGGISGTATQLGTFLVALGASNTLATGTATLSIDVVCGAGSYRAAPADLTCTPAPAGSFVAGDGATSATMCAVNTFSASTGATSCTPCAAGLQSDAGATGCTDRTPPVISGTPVDMSTSPTSPAGAVVTFASPTALDFIDGALPVGCAPSSGSTFAKGTTKVTCTATDAALNSASSSFYVTVGQSSRPTMTGTPFALQVNATGPGGAVVTYPAVTAVDAYGSSLQVVCTPASGSLLPLGQTKGSCTATDANFLTVSGTFTVTVVDTLGPSIVGLPAPIIAEATSNKGAAVTFTVPTATDLVDPLPTIKCDRTSGQWFAIGATVVTCTAADHSGNSTIATFTITVRDTTGPTIAVNKPVDGTTYKIGAKLAANYACSDTGSGIATCDGQYTSFNGLGAPVHVASGGTINTSVAGDFSFDVVAIDKAGNTRVVTLHYLVR